MWQKKSPDHYWTAGTHVEAHVRRASIQGHQTWNWEILQNGKVLRRSLPGRRDLFLAQMKAADCMVHYDSQIEESLQINKVVRRKKIADQVMERLRSG